jgi:hypothetical protein
MRSMLGALATMGLGIVLTSAAWAQDDKKSDGKQGQNQDKPQPSTQTIRGMVAEVTAEGELAIDYKTKQAVLVQAAFLTIVGSPIPGSRPKNVKQEQDEAGRDNVYIAWLSPRTKMYKVSGDANKPGPKREVSPDELEVGDFVEVRLNLRDATDVSPGSNQTDAMRKTHGRDRVYVGDAIAVTILPPKDDDDKPPPDRKDAPKPGTEKSPNDK